MINKKFGRLTVISQLKIRKNGYIVYQCRCECGTICNVSSSHLNRGTSSCGCARKDNLVGKKI